jgi:thioredoxin-like negative regulator of GroEL
MRIRRVVLLLVLVVVSGFLAVLILRPKPRPAILLVTIDTIRADHLSCYQRGHAMTPVLDALADSGVRFENPVTAAPLTLPSHATILTGVFPPDHGVRDNGFFRLWPEVSTVPERLAAAGYRTGAFVSTVILDRKFGLDQGFEVYDDEFDEPLDAETRFPESRRAEETVKKALDWLEGVADDERVFVWTHFYDPHAPYDPPVPFNRAYPATPYDGEIAYLDLMLGRLFAGFRARFGDDLLIVVVGDHGEAFGEHGEPTHGFLTYRGTARVPLIVAGPGYRGGTVVTEPVRTADVAATLLSAAGLDVPEAMRGRSLSRVLDGELTVLPCYTEAWTGISFGWSGLRMLRVGDLELIEGSRVELHDLGGPGAEDEDVGIARPDVLATMRNSMTALLSTTGVGSMDARRDLDPEDVEALRGLGYLTAGGGTPGRIDEVVLLDRADPRDRVGTYRKLIRLRELASLKEWEKAISLCDEVMAEDGENPVARLRRAEVLIQLKRIDEAVADLGFAAEKLPEDPRPPNMLGNVAFARQDLATAEAWFRRALGRDPNHYFALFRLGMIESLTGRHREAADTFRHVLRLSHDSGRSAARAKNNLGCALIKGKIDEAGGLGLLQEAVAEEPQAVDLRLSLADALINLGRPEEAIPHLEQVKGSAGDQPAIERLLRRAHRR